MKILLCLLLVVPALAQVSELTDDQKLIQVRAMLGPPENYVLAASSKMENYYYGKGKFRRTGGIVKIWFISQPRVVPTKDGSWFTYMSDIRGKVGLPTEGYDSYFSTKSLHEFDCIQDKFRILTYIDYNVKGEPLDSSNTPNAEWKEVVPGSISDGLSETACRISQPPTPKKKRK